MPKLRFPKTYAAFFLGIVVLLNMSCYDRLEPPDTPAETKPWVSKGGAMKEWGSSANSVWVASKEPEFLEVWQWDQNTMVKQHEIPLKWSSLDLVWLAGDKYVAAIDIAKPHEEWPFVLIDAKTGEQLRRWDCPPKLWYAKTGTSSNGKYIAILGEKDPNSFHSDSRCFIRLDLIDVNTLKLTETATLYDKHTEGWLGCPVVSDNGKYIGVPGWVNGAAMIDVEKRKELWSKVPADAFTLRVGAFSPDGKCFYVGGGCCRMYEMDTMTGKVLSKWLAADSQKPNYNYGVEDIAVSPDGQYVATAINTNKIYIWSKRTKKIRKIVTGADAVSFSPDSQNLATFSPGAIKIWPRKDWEDEKVK
ncbi:MAG: WD40 repeat domain-containing protein [Planctomycetia bacterium]|jgi:WD40 repeat protein